MLSALPGPRDNTGALTLSYSEFSAITKHRPIPRASPQGEGVLFAPFPTVMKVEPTAQLQVGLLSQRVPLGVGEDKGAVFLLKDTKSAIVHIGVAAGADTYKS